MPHNGETRVLTKANLILGLIISTMVIVSPIIKLGLDVHDMKRDIAQIKTALDAHLEASKPKSASTQYPEMFPTN
jgi:hypothetical protein